jgi:hypothetical protein
MHLLSGLNRSNICSDVPIELYGFPYAGTRFKNYQVTRFDSVLIYSISAGAGNETIILAERCSVTPLKCLCFVVVGQVPFKVRREWARRPWDWFSQ